MAQSSQRQIEALTGLRFFLALHVVAFHMLGTQLTWMPDLLATILQRGYLAVSTFFVLSGFVLTYVYLGHQAAPGIDRRTFWAARVARIYPIYALSLIVSVPLFVPQVIQAPGMLTASIVMVPVMLQSWWPATSEVWNGPAWSLSRRPSSI